MEIEEQKSKENDIYFKGASMEKIKEVLAGILGEEPSIRFKLAFKNEDNVENAGLIGLSPAHMQKVMEDKAQYLRNDETCNGVMIYRSLTKRQSRVRNALIAKLKQKEAPPAGKRWVIRSGEVVLVNDKRNKGSKNGGTA